MEASWYVAAVEGRCPHCRKGDLFTGWIALRETCGVCGARFERWSGAWTGPVVGGYAVGAGVGIGLILVLLAADALVPGAEWGISLVSCLAALATYRPIKASWIGLLYDWGYVFPDADRSEQVT